MYLIKVDIIKRYLVILIEQLKSPPKHPIPIASYIISFFGIFGQKPLFFIQITYIKKKVFPRKLR